MFEDLRQSADRSDLLAVIRHVRGRWRLKLALRGAAWVTGGGLIMLLASAWALEMLRFGPAALVTFRIVMALALAGLAGWFLVRPLARRVTDEQVALYLEEHEPGLDAAIVSAVEASRGSGGPSDRSAALTRRLIESALERCQTIGAGARVETVSLRRYAAACAAAALAAVALFQLGPDYLRHAASALLHFSRSIEAATPYRIHVDPGSVTIARGADQTIVAQLDGFEATHTELVVRRSPEAPFERIAMIPGGETDGFETMLFDVAGPIDYFVESTGVRSPTFTLSVVDLPYVQRLELEYHFPEYTGLSPRTVERGGDIAVLRGTEVRLRAHTTITTPGGEVRLDDEDVVPLTRQDDGTLTASFVVERDGFYRLALEADGGERVDGSPRYTIDVLDDMPPSVTLSRPGRDIRVSALEEVFVEARAEDDYGIRSLELVYSVNGGDEQRLALFGGLRGTLAEVTAGHTFYLEELGLESGDFISYYARATDNNQVTGERQATSDIYFLQIRPFGQEFRAADSQAGGGGAGGAEVGALSQQQRQIIAATFNVVRDRDTTPAEQFRENVVFLTLAQSRLREQVDGLVQRMNSRLVAPDPAFARIGELLPQAVEEMRAAEQQLQAQRPGEALAPEQRALQHLLKAEEEYELQVSTGGGGGGGAGSIAEDLAGLFELELDRLANQYETIQRADQADTDQQLDELLERLRELARRQEQEAERQRLRSAAGQTAQGGGASQRALAEQVEEAARRLERLSREQGRPDLMDSARRLQEAADAMRRAAASGDPAGAGQAGSALDRLREVEDRLRRGQAARAERDIADALRRAEELARDQREIAGDVRALGAADRNRLEQVQALGERKEALEGRVADLEQQLDRTAGEIRRDQREASRRVQQAADAIRDNKIREKIRYSRGVIRSGTPEYAQAFEDEISANLDELQEILRAAAGALGQPEGDGMAEALDQARRLARGVESLGERMRERGEQGGGSPGSEGADTAEAGEGGGQPGGQAGQSGQTAEGGQTAGAPGAAGHGPGWSGTWGAWGLTDEDIRQFRSEVRHWSDEAAALYDRLNQEGIEAGDFDEVLRAFRALDAERIYQDRAELERLQTFVEEALKRLEYSLRRRADLDGQPLFLSGTEEVPQGFRALVEEYYRSLSGRRE